MKHYIVSSTNLFFTLFVYFMCPWLSDVACLHCLGIPSVCCAISVCVCMCGHDSSALRFEVRGSSQASSSVAFYFIPLKQTGSLTEPEAHILAMLAGS